MSRDDPPTREALLGALRRDSAAISALLLDADLSARVPACPDWDLRALAVHLGGVHQWSRAALLGLDRRTAATEPGPDVAAWYRAAAASLVEALAQTPDDAPCWTFGDPPTARFWLRRQAHETAVHRWDAESAVGAPAPLDPDLAADGLDELLEVFLPRQVALGRCPQPPHAVALESADRRWVVGPGAPRSRVRGSAPDLLLLLWGRRPLDDRAAALAVEGDPDAVDALLALPLAP